MANILPFEFNEIINYSNITNAQSSSFIGYTYSAKNNSIKLDISNADDVNNQNEEDELVNAIINANKHEKDISQLKSQMKQLQQQNEELQSKVNQDNINANNTPIVAGSSGTTGIDHKGVYSHEVDNPNNMIRFQNGVIGISKNGDKEFVPVITKDGINPRFLQIPVQQHIAQVNDSYEKPSNNTLNGGESSGSPSGDIVNNITNIINPKIKYIDLPCKIIRDATTKKVVKIEYYKDGKLEYVDTLNRDSENKKVLSIVTEHIDKEVETTTLIRDPVTGIVTDIDVVYTNEDVKLEYIGMK